MSATVALPARMAAATVTVPTPSGAGEILLTTPVINPRADGRPRCLVVLGHGAGGGPDAADILAATRAFVQASCAVVRTVQPYRRAGRRAPAPAPALDAAFGALVGVARERWPDVPLVVGGRSSGGRVACRTAGTTGALAVVCLSFPLHPPRRPEASRAPEIAGVAVPVAVLQGERDPFGAPEEIRAAAPQAWVEPLPAATHSPRAGAALDAAAARLVDWVLDRVPAEG